MRWLNWMILVMFAWQVQASPAPLYTYRDLASGYMSCPFTARTDPLTQKNLNCEASAVAYSEKINALYIGADWWGKGAQPSIFIMDIPSRDGDSPLGRLMGNGQKQEFIKKIEGMTKTQDRKFVIGVTAFTHSPATYDAWDPINKVFYWESGLSERIRFPTLLVNGNKIATKDVNSKEYSAYLREGMLKAIHSKYPDVEFFKVEGLSTLPGNKLAIGVREIGTNYMFPTFKALILMTEFSIENDVMVLDADFKLEYDFELRKRFNIAEKIGLSSIEYDYQRNRLYLMTSYEKGKSDEDLGAYLWVSSINQQTGRLTRPKAVVDENLKYFHFAHKGEGMTIDPAGNIILIADDDRVLGRAEKDIVDRSRQFSREPYQAAYKILRITPRKLKSTIPH